MKPVAAEALRAGDIGRFLAEYHSSLDSCIKELSEVEAVKSVVSAKGCPEFLDILHASAVLSDIVVLELDGTYGQATFSIPRSGERTLEIPIERLAELGIRPGDPIPQMAVGYMASVEESQIRLLQELVPLVESGRLLIRPERLAMVKTGENDWAALRVESDAMDARWVISNEKKRQGLIPVRMNQGQEMPVDILLPYLRGLATTELVRVLNDCEDCLLGLRKAVREGIRQIGGNGQADMLTFKRDVIDPEVERIRREFKRVTGVRSIAMAGVTVGLFSLSLTALLSGNGPIAGVAGLLGSGGVWQLGSEFASYKEQLAKLKDNPFYLFWRAQQVKTKR